MKPGCGGIRASVFQTSSIIRRCPIVVNDLFVAVRVKKAPMRSGPPFGTRLRAGRFLRFSGQRRGRPTREAQAEGAVHAETREAGGRMHGRDTLLARFPALGLPFTADLVLEASREMRLAREHFGI